MPAAVSLLLAHGGWQRKPPLSAQKEAVFGCPSCLEQRPCFTGCLTPGRSNDLQPHEPVRQPTSAHKICSLSYILIPAAATALPVQSWRRSWSTPRRQCLMSSRPLVDSQVLARHDYSLLHLCPLPLTHTHTHFEPARYGSSPLKL